MEWGYLFMIIVEREIICDIKEKFVYVVFDFEYELLEFEISDKFEELYMVCYGFKFVEFFL